MPITITHGCLISNFKDKSYDAIVHGCNCFHTMGAGIAKIIKNNFPLSYEADLETRKGDKNKLGTYSIAHTDYGLIINAYTQFNYTTKKVNCDYDAIEKVFKNINIDFKNKIIGIPKIGAGLAGGNWNKILKIIEDNTPDVNIHVVEYS